MGLAGLKRRLHGGDALFAVAAAGAHGCDRGVCRRLRNDREFINGVLANGVVVSDFSNSTKFSELRKIAETFWGVPKKPSAIFPSSENVGKYEEENGLFERILQPHLLKPHLRTPEMIGKVQVEILVVGHILSESVAFFVGRCWCAFACCFLGC